MYYCGIDIGIKNMALCFVNETIIQQWVVCNLFEPVLCDGLLKSGNKCNKLCKFKTNYHKYYCGIHKTEDCKKYKQKLTTQYTVDEVMKAAFNCMDKYAEFFSQTNIVIIEQQVKANPKMRLLSNAIHAYFLLIYKNIDKVVYSPAKNKLKVWKGGDINITPGGKALKKIAVEHIKKLLPPEILDQFFNKETKKDDLADAYLHYRYYYEKHC